MTGDILSMPVAEESTLLASVKPAGEFFWLTIELTGNESFGRDRGHNAR